MSCLLSLCMICKNEEAHIKDCLKSVVSIVDEMIVVDTGSTDKTVDIAKEMGAKVFIHQWDNDFSKARNIGLNKAKGKWILFLDADERLHSEDANKVRPLLERNDHMASGFYCKMINFVGDSVNDSHTEVVPVLRLFRQNKDVRFQGRIHEQIGGDLRNHFPSLQVLYTDIRINHYGYLTQIVRNKKKVERNLKLLLQQVKDEPENAFHHYNLAGEWIRSNEYEKALEELQLSKSLCQIETMGFGHLVIKKEVSCLFYLKKFKDAYHLCEKEVKRFPNYPDLLFLYGQSAVLCHEIEKAEKIFMDILTIKDIPPYYSYDATVIVKKAPMELANLYSRQQKKEKAKQYYQQVIINFPHEYKAYDHLLKVADIDDLLSIWNEEELEKIAQHYVKVLYHAGQYDTAKQLADRFQEAATNDLKEKLFALTKDPSIPGNSIVSTITGWVQFNDKVPTTQSDISTFLHFLNTYDWPSEVEPTEQEWDALLFTHRLCCVYKDQQKSSIILSLLRYLVAQFHHKEGSWYVGLALCYQARALKTANKQLNELYQQIDNQLPLVILE